MAADHSPYAAVEVHDRREKSAADFMIHFSPRVTPLNGGLPQRNRSPEKQALPPLNAGIAKEASLGVLLKHVGSLD